MVIVMMIVMVMVMVMLMILNECNYFKAVLFLKKISFVINPIVERSYAKSFAAFGTAHCVQSAILVRERSYYQKSYHKFQDTEHNSLHEDKIFKHYIHNEIYQKDSSFCGRNRKIFN